MGIPKELIFGGKKTPTENKEVNNNIKQIEVSKMVDFRLGQPFSLYSKEKMEQMKESILRNGILSPIIARAIEEDKYEIIAGHNRVKCARELDIQTVPTIIVEVDDDNAKLIMLETNLCQRDDIPPVEKGVAYKMQLETLKKIREKEATQIEQGYSVEKIAKQSGDSRATIQRLIRLTELIESLQEKVNKGEQIPISAGVELSYINKEEQEVINKILEDNNLKLTIAQAEYLREIKGTITEQSVVEMFAPKKKEAEVKFTGKISKDTLKKYREKFASNDEFDELINKLLEEYFSQSEVN